jgi:NAD-dependent dihydropyrimidine dehydrogenase PreA subunit
MPLRPVPREKVPWYPSVDADKCTGCRVCVEYCGYGVYAFNEGTEKAEVLNPFGCVVGCNGCENLCANGAISFPEIDAIQKIIRKLREG